MPVTLEQDEAGNTVTFEGAVDISSAADLRKLLLQALDSGKEIRISLADATALDVTAVQLLWAIEREVKLAGIGFALVGQVPESISSALVYAGFEKFPVTADAK